MKQRASLSVLGLALLAGGGSFGCAYNAATEACYALADGLGARLNTCGYAATAESGAQAVHDVWATQGLYCDSSPTGIDDEDAFYDECFPALEVYDCAMLAAGEMPETCYRIVYRSR